MHNLENDTVWPALSWNVQLLTAPTHIKHSVKNKTRSCTDVVFVREGLSPVSYLSPFVCICASSSLSCVGFLPFLLPFVCCFFVALDSSCVGVYWFCWPCLSLVWVCFIFCWPCLFPRGCVLFVLLALPLTRVGVCCSFVGLASSRMGVFFIFGVGLPSSRVFCICCWPGPFPCGCILL